MDLKRLLAEINFIPVSPGEEVKAFRKKPAYSAPSNKSDCRCPRSNKIPGLKDHDSTDCLGASACL